MIKDIEERNETVKINDTEIAVLKEHFPACFNPDGSFDVERLAAQLSDKVSISHEGYELRFLGKSYAKLLASIDTTTVIKPDTEHNSKPENARSENIYISGDNLDGLKHLLKSYAKQVKCIYIDPPYNTGTDGFVYNDKFSFTSEELQQRLSVDETQANHILDLTKRNSASHSAWLLFMYARLQLARDLLKNDGVIFISIDDNEQANLKLLCDDIFGEENFVAELLWKRRASSALSDNNVSTDHEYVICYQRGELKDFNGIGKDFKNYSNPDNDIRGNWVAGDLTVGMTASMRPNQAYDLIDPITGKVYPFNPNRVWSFIPESMNRLIEEGKVLFPSDTSKRPMMKRFKNELKSNHNPFSSLMLESVGLNSEATRIIRDTLGSNLFDYSKPLSLLKTILPQICNNDDTVLDFFSGSATTAHAVMQLNAEDGGKRKVITVQLQEVLDPKNTSQKAAHDFLQSIKRPTTLDYIGIERIIRAGKKIKEETGADIDYGFKHYELREVNENTLDKCEVFDKNALIADTTILDDFGTETILTTWLVNDGYGFNAEVKTMDLGGYTAYYCQKHLYLIHSYLTQENVAALYEKYSSVADFNPENIVMFGYSFNEWSVTEMLEKNLRVLNDTEKNLKINIDVRY
jgi:DNA modification methylase